MDGVTSPDATPSVRPERSPAGPWIVAALAFAAHLVVGYFSVLSGLAVPLYALAPLWVLWVVLAFRLQRLAIARSWWTPVVPLVMAVALVLTVVVGSAAFGWTA